MSLAIALRSNELISNAIDFNSLIARLIQFIICRFTQVSCLAMDSWRLIGMVGLFGLG
jgi:hypothetical protein